MWPEREDGTIIVTADPHPLLLRLGPVAWITDEAIDRATFFTNKHLPGRAPEPAQRHGESWLMVKRKPIIGDFECWLVKVITPIAKGEKRGRSFTYILEHDVRDLPRALTRMRWPD